MISPIPRIAALPAITPFVGPEALARQNGVLESDVLRLGANESTFGASPQVASAIAAELPRISFYADPDVWLLRQALAAHCGCTMEQIVVGSGIDDLLGLFLRAYVGEGGLALATTGTYPTFFYQAEGYGARVETVAYAVTRPNLAALSELAQKRQPALVYLANPDNPGGGFHGRAALAEFIAALPATTVLLLDEAYAEFAPAPERLPFLPSPQVIHLRTFSKAYGLAGLRIGYAVADARVIADVEKIRQHFGVGRLPIVAALAALRDQEFVEGVLLEVARGRNKYAQIASEVGLRSHPSSTNFVLFDCGSVERAVALVPALFKLGIFIRKPMVAELAHCVRISVGTAMERQRLRELLPQALAACPPLNHAV